MGRRIANIITTVLLTGVFIFVGVWVFSSSYIRLWQGVEDFGISIAYYVCEIFGVNHNITPTVNTIPEVQTPQVTLPTDFEGFKSNTAQYFSLLFSKDNFSGWFEHLARVMGGFAKILIIALPCIVAVIFTIKALYGRKNIKHGKDTVPLKVFKFISKFTYQPVKRFILGYVDFVRRNGGIWKCWVVLWAFNFNLATIVVEFFAYYFYFAVSFNFGTVYTQFIKLFADLKTPFIYFPWWALVFLVYPLFDRFRRRIATARLRHFEARNCGFINELPIVSMSCGSMGKKKTTLITDMALSQEVMFRQKALDILQKSDLKFPYFPWIQFELELRRCMEFHTVYNLATIKAWVKKKRNRFYKHRDAKLQLYGYDYMRYGLTYNDGLKTSNLFEVLETYAQAYFIYVIESSLIVANYSIRTDSTLMDGGNFPIWLTDFFPMASCRESRHAHILDFDLLRLGKKLIDDNPNIGSFEFGVVVISEVGKERGNNLELKEVRKGKDETNQKNDLFNSWLKMCRHSATVDNYPFVKVFTDEQRPESWGADARDLCDIINIVKSSVQKLALPFYTIEDMISEWAFNRFINLYYDFRYRRGDNTLLVHILKSVTAWLWRRNIRVYNNYGYCILRIEKERGTMDVKADKKKYYIMNKKVYSRRFSTDCFSDYFNDMAKKAKVGIDDYREYVTERANVDELKAQNSYFINSLYS